MTDEQMAQWRAQIAETKAEAEAKSSFKLHQQVRVCRSPGFSLTTGSFPHDHDDPDQHFDSRIVGWDIVGRIEVATIITSNPHMTEWCWTDDMIHPRAGWDWFTDRTDDRIWQKLGSEIYFMWEEPGWKTGHGYDDHYGVGETVKGILECPHINYGDWIVRYEKPSGSWITRVLNERQMWLRE